MTDKASYTPANFVATFVKLTRNVLPSGEGKKIVVRVCEGKLLYLWNDRGRPHSRARAIDFQHISGFCKHVWDPVGPAGDSDVQHGQMNYITMVMIVGARR